MSPSRDVTIRFVKSGTSFGSRSPNDVRGKKQIMSVCGWSLIRFWLVLLFPLFAVLTSTGLFGSQPLYSRIRNVGVGRRHRELHSNDVRTRGGRCNVLGSIWIV